MEASSAPRGDQVCAGVAGAKARTPECRALFSQDAVCAASRMDGNTQGPGIRVATPAGTDRLGLLKGSGRDVQLEWATTG